MRAFLEEKLWGNEDLTAISVVGCASSQREGGAGRLCFHFSHESNQE